VVAEPSSGLVAGDYRGVAGSGGSDGGQRRGGAARRRAEPEGQGVGG
jgi:hypothetical protein